MFEMWWWNENTGVWERWPMQRIFSVGGVCLLEINITDSYDLTGTPFAILASRLAVGGIGEVGGGINLLSVGLIVAGVVSLVVSAILYYRVYRSDYLRVVK